MNIIKMNNIKMINLKKEATCARIIIIIKINNIKMNNNYDQDE